MKKVIGSIILLSVFVFLIYSIYDIYRENNIKEYKEENIKEEKHTENIKQNSYIIENADSEKKDLKLVQKEYKGYTVSAKLKIPKLDIDTCVLEDSSKEAMEVAIAKYFGPEPNEIGNYCIAGHNYITKNMFSELGKLEIGDTFVLTDNKNGEVKYTIYDKYKVKPDQTQALSQKTNGKREVTLITCSDYSTKRIVIKAKAI